MASRSKTLVGRCQAQQQSTFAPRPAPPRLPKEEQEEYEMLQKKSAGAFSGGDELHPDLRRKPKAEFEGEKNPKTGEIGGPKNDPLRHGDYSYGGRCTDF